MKALRTVGLATGLIAMAGVCRAQAVSSQARRSAERLAATVCMNCHGTAGRSTSPTFPNLAAQTVPYLEQQLKAFRGETRADPDAQAYMWGMASRLDDSTITALAEHYSSQRPSPGYPGNAQREAAGRKIFEHGVLAKGIPACATCHGDHAQGNGPFPRLAGQHAAYLLKQLLVIQNALRNAPVMHGIIEELTRDQMRDVADYLASIGPRTGKPRAR
jgi:cytochrome c553